VSGLRPTIFKNINLRYYEISGQKTYNYPNNRCDLYFFDNYLVIIRSQYFIFKVLFAPILLTPDISSTKPNFSYLSIYKPDRITFKDILKGEVDIQLTDQANKHYITRITLKGLTNEQKNQLEKVKNWCSQI